MQYPAYHEGENGILQGVVTAIISMLWNVVMDRRFMNFAGQGRAASMVDRLPRLNAGMHTRGTQSRSRDQGLMTSVTGTKDNALDGDAPSYIYRVVESMGGK